MSLRNEKSHVALTAHKNAGETPSILSTYTEHRAEAHTNFFVEAKPARRWISVGGPFGTVGAAESFAQNFSRTNRVPTRVVAFQSQA